MDPRSFWEGRVELARQRNVDVRLDEAKIALDGGADVLHPLNGAFLMSRDRASSESIALLVYQHRLGSGYLRFNVLINHFRLMVIGGIFSGLEIPAVSRHQGLGGNTVPLSKHR